MFRDYRRVEGFESDYIISNNGEVWSIKFGKVRLMKQTPNTHGYLYVNLSENGKRKTIKIHVLVGIHFVGLRTGEMTYDHKDTNKLNNKADNLRLATKSEQAQNQKTRKNNKLGFKHICEMVHRSGSISYIIHIARNGKTVYKSFRKDKYSLENIVEERDRILLLM